MAHAGSSRLYLRDNGDRLLQALHASLLLHDDSSSSCVQRKHATQACHASGAHLHRTARIWGTPKGYFGAGQPQPACPKGGGAHSGPNQPRLGQLGAREPVSLPTRYKHALRHHRHVYVACKCSSAFLRVFDGRNDVCKPTPADSHADKCAHPPMRRYWTLFGHAGSWSAAGLRVCTSVGSVGLLYATCCNSTSSC